MYKSLLFIICIFTTSHFGYAQHVLPELPKCQTINLPQNSSLESLIDGSTQKLTHEPLISFCILFKESNRVKTVKEKSEIALKANEIGSKLYIDAKYKEAIYFQSFAGHLWAELDSTKKHTTSIRKLGENFYRLGDIYNSISYLNDALSLSKKNNYKNEKYHIYIALAWSYNRIHNFKEAKKNILLSKSMIDNKTISANYYMYYRFISSLYRTQNKISLAMKYNDSTIAIAKKENNIGLLALSMSNKANYLIYTKGNIDSILKNILFALRINKQMNDKNQLSSNYGVLAKAYLYDNNYSEAINAANKGLEYTKETGNLYEETIKYKILKKIYSRIGDYKKAYYYAEKYNSLYKEVYGLVSINKIFDIQQQHAEELNKSIIINLKNEKKISELKNKQSKQINWLIIITSLLLLGATIFYFARIKVIQKQKNEVQKQQLSHKLLQMEMDALRSRMNPHFIFNSLNSIKSFIISNDVKSSVSYFSKFAKLLRYSINNSSINFVSLNDEINFLKDYVALENLRLSNSFDFIIEFPDDLDIESLKVPPLIIQPFIENAIWHGLSLVKNKGLLRLKIVSANDYIEIHIIDNGIGREASAILNKNKIHNSKGISITTERLEIFSKIYKLKKSFEIIDLKDNNDKVKGTKVIIKLPLLYNDDLLKRKT